VILGARLYNQLLAGAQPRRAADIVDRLCAMQSQDFPGAKWAIGLRASGLDDAAVEKAYNKGAILRTHVLRPTWHFVTPADIRWMLTLTAPRVHKAVDYYIRQVGLDAKKVARAHRVLAAELTGGRFRTRGELAAALAKRGVEVRGIALGVLTIHAEIEQVMCSGPMRGKLFTYASLDERAPTARARSPRDPAAELARRYFVGHGPATVRDFSWWSGLSLRQAQRAVETASPALVPREVGALRYWASSWDGIPARMPHATFVLPNYDEYVIAYKDRDVYQRPGAQPKRGTIAGLNPYEHPIVVDGLLAGYWTRRGSGGKTRIELVVDMPLSVKQRRAVNEAADRLVEFSGAGCSLAGRL
jgi:hypothetical protein